MILVYYRDRFWTRESGTEGKVSVLNGAMRASDVAILTRPDLCSYERTSKILMEREEQIK